MFESIGTIFPADRDHLQLKNYDRLVSNTDKLAARACILLRLCSPSGLFPGWSRSQTSSQNQLSNLEKFSLELCAENSSIPFRYCKPDFSAPQLPSPCQFQDWPGCLFRITPGQHLSGSGKKRVSPIPHAADQVQCPVHQDRLTLFAVVFLLVLDSPHPSGCSPTYLAILATDQISSLAPRVVVGLCRLPTICLTQVRSSCGKDGQCPGSHVEGSP